MRILAVLAVFAVLVAGIVLLLPGEDREIDGGAPPDATVAGSGEASVLTPAETAAPEAATLPRVEVEGSPPPTPEAAPTGATEETEGLQLVRVEDPSGAPVAECPVVVLARHADLPFAAPLGGAYTDGDGLARIEEDELMGIDLEGVVFSVALGLELDPPVEAPFDPGLRGSSRPTVLVLPAGSAALLEDVLVRVVDASGEALEGIRVTYTARQVDGSSNASVGEATTGADGLARIPREEERELRRRALLMGGRFRFEVEADVPLCEPLTAPFTEPGEIIELRLPPTAALLVEVRRADGSAVEGGGSVRLWHRASGSGEGVRFERSAGWVQELEEGVARFGPLGTALELKVSASLDDRSVDEALETFPGPAVAGEVRRVLVLGASKPVLTGRLLDAEGGPLGGLRFSLSFEPVLADPDSYPGRRGRTNHGYHGTDAGGRFALAVPGGGSLDGGQFAVIEEQPPRSGKSRGWIARYARAVLPNPVPISGEVDVGDLVLAPVPLLAAGTVRDPAGTPVRGASVRLQYPAGPDDSEGLLNLATNLRTDEGGRFALHGLQRVREIRARATHADLDPSVAVTAAPGRDDLRLVLGTDSPREKPPMGRLRVEFSVEDELSTSDLELAFRSAEQGTRSEPLFRGRGRYDLPPGEWTLQVRTDDTEWSLFESEPFRIRVDEETEHGRIDLRGLLRPLRLRLVHGNHLPLVTDWARIALPGERGGYVKTDDQGRVRLLIRTSDDLFEVWTEQHARQGVSWSPAEQTLVLVPK